MAEELGLSTADYEFQTLYGMADPIKAAFVARGITVREYAPIGDMLTGMAYLVRRLLENTANEGFIRSGLVEGESAEALFARPDVEERDPGTGHLESDPRETFRNTPLLDFSIASNREAVTAALQPLLGRRNGDYPRVFPKINGSAVKDCEVFQSSESPEEPALVLGTVGMASADHLAAAVEGLEKGFMH